MESNKDKTKKKRRKKKHQSITSGWNRTSIQLQYVFGEKNKHYKLHENIMWLCFVSVSYSLLLLGMYLQFTHSFTFD